MAKDERAQKVYVNQEGLAVIKCPVCAFEKSTRVDSSVIREKDMRDNCMVRCTCQIKFAVKLEFRKDFRKDSEFSGEYMKLPTGKPRGRLTVVNISRNGIGLRINGPTQFEIGDELLSCLPWMEPTTLSSKKERRFGLPNRTLSVASLWALSRSAKHLRLTSRTNPRS